MLEKQTVIDEISLTESGAILYRERTTILNDGQPLGLPLFARYSLSPGDSLDNVPSEVADFCRWAWTPERIANYTERLRQSAPL
jgi:hypothetical protein